MPPFKLPKQSEKSFQAQVEQLAYLRGWRHRYHTRYSFGSSAGFPDLVIVRPPRIVFAELKRVGKKPNPAQREWLDALGACPVEVYVWTPDNWPEIERVLT